MDPSTINLLDEDAFDTEKPAEWFQWLRDNEPVFWHDEPGERGFWVVTRHADVTEVNRDHKVFSSAQEYGGVIPFEEEKIQAMAGMAGGIALMLTMDDPAHARQRKLVSRAFTPRAMSAVEDRLRELSSTLIDDALAQGTCDWVTTVAQWLPVTAITELVGCPAEERPKVLDWANRTTGATDPEFGSGPESMMAAGLEFVMWTQAMAEERKREPRDDVLTTLLTAEVDGERLNEMEVILFFMLLLNAGTDTTRNAISRSVIEFARQPELYEHLRANPSILPTAIEELLRWATPVTYMRRTPVVDTEIAGQAIKAGDKVTIWYESANRDEAVFADPWTIDLRRDPNHHITFGAGGAHYCLGAALARTELRLILEEMIGRIARFELVGEPERVRSNMINGTKHLPVTVVPA